MGLTWVLMRYDMSSDSPSGGMKEMVRSLSKRERRTHWWNFTSSITTVFPLSPEDTGTQSVVLNRSAWEVHVREAGEPTSGETKEHSIVEAQAQLRHPREHRLQLNAAHYVAAHHAAIGIHLDKQYAVVDTSECFGSMNIAVHLLFPDPLISTGYA